MTTLEESPYNIGKNAITDLPSLKSVQKDCVDISKLLDKTLRATILEPLEEQVDRDFVDQIYDEILKHYRRG